jgi:hypothetical protein
MKCRYIQVVFMKQHKSSTLLVMSFGIYVCIEKYSTPPFPFLDLSPPHIDTLI